MVGKPPPNHLILQPPKDPRKSILRIRVLYWEMSAENIGDRNKSWGLESGLGVEEPILVLRPVQKKLSGGTQGYGEGEVVPKGAPTWPVDLEDSDPGGEYNHPQEEAHSWAPDICKREQEGKGWPQPALWSPWERPSLLFHKVPGFFNLRHPLPLRLLESPSLHLIASLPLCPGLTAFDLALLRVCRDNEGLSEEPENVDQPEKRQEGKPTWREEKRLGHEEMRIHPIPTCWKVQ